MPMDPVTLTICTPATRLYRRATDQPARVARPAVVQSRARRGPWGATGDRIPFPERRWLVVSPWPVPGTVPLLFGLPHGLSVVKVATYAEAVALATASARQHAEATS